MPNRVIHPAFRAVNGIRTHDPGYNYTIVNSALSIFKLNRQFNLGTSDQFNAIFRYFCIMKKRESLSSLLKSASESVKRTAHRKNVPIAISEDGCVKLIYPDNRVKIISKTPRCKEKA